MRVITGTARGRKLIATAGEETRPTSDWTKESIFNIIQFDIEGRRVLDLFAGTGQMGIEALSRGARDAVFLDNRRESIDVIVKNLQTTGFTDRAKVELGDFRGFLRKAKPGSFGLVFVDPPYNEGLIKLSVSAIMRGDLVADGGLIVVESDKNEELPAVAAPYVHHKDYFYGRSRITIYIKKQGEKDEDSDIPGQL